MSRMIEAMFDKYRVARFTFAEKCAEYSQMHENSEQLIKQGAVILLRNLLTDSSTAIQQHATMAIERLAAHDPKIAEVMIQQDILRILLHFTMDSTNVMSIISRVDF